MCLRMICQHVSCVKRLSDKTTGRIQREECFSSENRMHSLCTFLKLIMLPIALQKTQQKYKWTCMHIYSSVALVANI